MLKLFANLIRTTTEILHWILSFFVDEQVLLEWKPIHLCWWFRKHGWQIPKYFIGINYTANLIPTMTSDTAPSDGRISCRPTFLFSTCLSPRRKGRANK